MLVRKGLPTSNVKLVSWEVFEPALREDILAGQSLLSQAQ